MAKIMSKSRFVNEGTELKHASDVYTGKEKTGPMVWKPTKDLEQWLKEANELYAREAEVRKQA